MSEKSVNLNVSNEEPKTVETTYLCTRGRVMATIDDVDTLGSDSGMCCPDCGNEDFQSIAELQAELEAVEDKNTEMQIAGETLQLECNHFQAQIAQLKGRKPIPGAWWKDCPDLAQVTMERIIERNDKLETESEKLKEINDLFKTMSKVEKNSGCFFYPMIKHLLRNLNVTC